MRRSFLKALLAVPLAPLVKNWVWGQDVIYDLGLEKWIDLTTWDAPEITESEFDRFLEEVMSHPPEHPKIIYIRTSGRPPNYLWGTGRRTNG